MNLYVTADRVGIESGGGKVTLNESEALKSLGPCEVWGRDRIEQRAALRPDSEKGVWEHDERMSTFPYHSMSWYNCYGDHPIIHFYAGAFGRTIAALKSRGVYRITYTAAAHDKDASRREHEKLGVPFDYPHLTDPALWERYLAGYKAADVLIVPSTHSRDVMRSYGCTNRIQVIPHGVDLPPPEKVKPIRTDKFVVGYLGDGGAPDKGLRYLLEAWGKLNYRDGSELILAGPDSQSEWVKYLISEYSLLPHVVRSVRTLGWVKDITDFYNMISLYVQPSVTEGFGIEVLEAMAHGRLPLVSKGAGACDLVPEGMLFQPGPEGVGELMHLIHWAKQYRIPELHASHARVKAAEFTWEKIRQRYVDLWKELLA